MNAMDLMKALGGLPEEDIAEELSYQSPRKRPAFLVSRSFLAGASTAACLLLIVGLGVGIWSRQQKIETRPPQESIPVTPTETSTETTTQVTTASQTTSKQTETTIKVTTQTGLPVIVPETTAVQTAYTTTAQAATMYTAPATVIQTSPLTTAAQTIPTTVATVPTCPQNRDTVPQNVRLPSVTVTETQPVQITEPVTVPQTETVLFTETTAVPETAPVRLTGFRVEQYPDCQKVICTDDFPEPDGELQSYLVISDELVLLAASEPVNAERIYEVECPEAGKVFTVTQREYSEFVLTVDEGELINIALNNVHGFFLLQDETCSLYWFRDGEGFYVQCDVDDLEYLMEIARSFTPAGEQK